MRSLASSLCLSFLALTACGGRDNSTVDSGVKTNTDAGSHPVTDAGGGNPVISVTEAVTNLSQYSGGAVEIHNAVVIAATTPYASNSASCVGSKMVESFYIMDATGGPGIGVYKSCAYDVATPAIGDAVTVSGRLSKFDGSLQISGSSKYNIPLVVTVTGAGQGHTTGGANPPAGSPSEIASADMAGYAHSLTNPHPDKVGSVLHFGGVTVTSMRPAGFITTSADGGVTNRGFEITGGVWVDDTLIYHDCIKPLALDGGTLPLPNGVRGAWDRYQDYYGGTSSNPAPTLPVLVPLSCADIQ